MCQIIAPKRSSTTGICTEQTYQPNQFEGEGERERINEQRVYCSGNKQRTNEFSQDSFSDSTWELY